MYFLIKLSGTCVDYRIILEIRQKRDKITVSVEVLLIHKRKQCITIKCMENPRRSTVRPRFAQEILHNLSRSLVESILKGIKFYGINEDADKVSQLFISTYQ